MEKEDFYKILCTSTPEEINQFISSKGKKKMVNAITFVYDDNYEGEKLSNKIESKQKDKHI